MGLFSQPGSPLTRYKTGRYYGPKSRDIVANNTVITNGMLYAVPFTVHQRHTFDRIAIEVGTGQADSSVRLGIYDDNDGEPSTLIVDSDAISTATNGVKETAIAVTLNPGQYWLAAQMTATGTVPTLMTFSTVSGPSGDFVGVVAVTTQFAIARFKTGASGALPDPIGTLNATDPGTGRGPLIMLRAA